MTIIKTFEVEEEKGKFPKIHIFLVSMSLIVLTLVEIWVSNTVIGYGEKFGKLSSLEKRLRLENQILENLIAENSSLVSIASKSAQLGFIDGQSIQYIR